MLSAEDVGALVKPLHSGDPDVMQLSRSLLRFEHPLPHTQKRSEHLNNAIQMVLCKECSLAVQEVPGSIPD